MGGFELTCNERHIPLPRSAQRLVAFLALNERPVLRSHAAHTLWLDSSDARSSGSLRTALWRLRRPGCELVELSGERMHVSRNVTVDVRRIAAVVRQLVREDRRLDSEELEELASGGELLPGWHEDWVLMNREQTRQLWLQALEAASERLAATGRPAGAVIVGLAAVEAEPLRESAHRAVIKAHLAMGNRAEALRQYERHVEVMWRELHLEPSPELGCLAGVAERTWTAVDDAHLPRPRARWRVVRPGLAGGPG
jgi:DNA-binding SARP family transcriptional activator